MNNYRHKYLWFATSISLAIGLGARAAPGSDAASLPTVTPVTAVDLTRYAGRWYEIARIPNRFQKACKRDTTADYAIRDDGQLEVVNRCTRDDGSPDEASGVARIVDGSGNAKLKVSFVSIFGWRPFWGDYWVIGLDENYLWAIVGHPSRKYGWILARTQDIDDDTLAHILTIVEGNGYQRNAFEMTSHRVDTE